MDCGYRCLKYVLFAFNFIFWLLGIVVMGFGIYSIVKAGDYKALIEETNITSGANILIASGALVCLIGFFGCCGAIKDSKCMLIIYAILVFLIFVLEIAAGILTYTMKGKVEKEFTKSLDKIVSKNYGKDTEAEKVIDKALDWFQQNVGCCGVNGTADWAKASKNIPASCCKTNSASANCTTAANNLYTDGCVDAGKNFVNDNLASVAGIGVGIAVVQLFVMIAACCLCRAHDDEDHLA